MPTPHRHGDATELTNGLIDGQTACPQLDTNVNLHPGFAVRIATASLAIASWQLALA